MNNTELEKDNKIIKKITTKIDKDNKLDESDDFSSDDFEIE